MSNDPLQQKVYSVSEITRSIKHLLEGRPDLNNIWIKGEIFNLTFHSSGHIYFSLRDDDAVISAVFFRHANRSLDFKPREGMTVHALGSVTVYEKRGSYQINVTMLRPEGVGDLQRRIELLKQKLMKEGVFDPARKRPIPFLPRRLGIATSPTGAAVRDIIKVALRRYPNIQLVIAPAVVQGADAPVSIARAIEELNRPEHGIDCIIAGRGGGSFEDLMPFNEEIVVRAFYNSRVPIISAVGHQVDHPLCDDAADLAAPTPSAAAEMVVPEKKELSDEIDYYALRINNSIQSLVGRLGDRITNVSRLRIFRDPYEIVNRKEMLLADLSNQILISLKDTVASHKSAFQRVPDIGLLIRNVITDRKHAFIVGVRALEQLSPLGVLRRGYAIAQDEAWTVIRSVADTAVGRLVSVTLADGALKCTVNSIQTGGYDGKKEDC